jgi:ABC-2 type transporter
MVQAATAMGYFLSSVFNSETAAVAFAPIMNLPLSLLGGYMLNLESIKGKSPQKFIEWVQYISPVRYCFNGLMKAQWPIKTVPSQYSGLDSNPDAVTSVPYQTQQVIDIIGTNLAFGDCVLGLFMLWILFRTLTVVSLTLQDHSCQIHDSSDTRNVNLQQQEPPRSGKNIM